MHTLHNKNYNQCILANYIYIYNTQANLNKYSTNKMNQPTKPNLPFKKCHTLQQRIQKSKKQMLANPGKIVIIVQKHPNSTLATLTNPRFLCQKEYKFNTIKTMLQKKIKQMCKNDNGKNSFFVFINKVLPNPQTTMIQLYDKYKDQDGFLYMQYHDQQSL